MSAYLSFDKYRLIVFAPTDLEESAGQATRHALENRLLRSSLRRGIRPYSDLNKVQVRTKS